MTWGSHCPDCGKEDCSWVRGPACDGGTRRLLEGEDGLRLQPAPEGSSEGWKGFHVQESVRTFFGRRWVAVEGTFAATPEEAAGLALGVRNGEAAEPSAFGMR